MAVEVLPPAARSRQLPSLSALSGNVREGVATGHIERSMKDFHKGGLRIRPATSGNDALSTVPSHPPTQPQVVGVLSKTANHHLSKLKKTPAAPYQRVMTPEDNKIMREQVVQHLKALVSTFRASQEAAAAADAAQAASASDLPCSSPDPLAGGHASTMLRPSTSLPFTELLMPRPGSRMRRMSTPSDWSEAGATWGFNQTGRTTQSLSSRLSTPSPMGSARTALLRASLPSALAPTKPEVWRNPQGALVSPGGTVEGPRTPSRGGGTEQTNPNRVQWEKPPGSANRKAIGTTAANVTGALVDFVPTRGMVYSVFSELDGDDCGKMTYSAFEDAAFKIGMKVDHVRRFFDSLDQHHRGYINVNEWGNRKLEAQVLNFTRLYVQTTRGASGRHKDAPEISSLGMAVELAMHRLKLKNSGRSISSQRLSDAFRFIDTDNSGALDIHEIADAFNALGIMVKPSIVNGAMAFFDRDHSGTIDYNEFLRTLFPTLSKGAYNMQG